MLSWIFHFINRRKSDSLSDAQNVVRSIAKAETLYKDLLQKAHPDKNPLKVQLATEITNLLNRYRKNYDRLLQIKERIDNEL